MYKPMHLPLACRASLGTLAVLLLLLLDQLRLESLREVVVDVIVVPVLQQAGSVDRQKWTSQSSERDEACSYAFHAA